MKIDKIKFDKILKKKLERSIKSNQLENSNKSISKVNSSILKSHSTIEYPIKLPFVGKKFLEEDVKPKVLNQCFILLKYQAKEAKKYVKVLVDADILELNKKCWNISSSVNENIRPELKKTLFEVNLQVTMKKG